MENNNQKPTFEQLPELFNDLRNQFAELKDQVISYCKTTQITENQDIPNMDVQAAADFLSLTVPTIYSKVSKGELPSMKRGNRLYFSRKDLIAYLQEGRRLTNTEINALADDYISNGVSTNSKRTKS